MSTTRRRNSLTPMAERVVLALLGAGCPLDVAAAFIGSTARVIRASRNKGLRQRLADAELAGELALLRDIAQAAETDPEAAQWLNDYMRKSPVVPHAAPPTTSA